MSCFQKLLCLVAFPAQIAQGEYITYNKAVPIDSDVVTLTDSLPHHSENTDSNPLLMCAMLGRQSMIQRMFFNVDGSQCNFATIKKPLFKQLFLPPENITLVADRDDVFYYSDACESTNHDSLRGFHVNLLEDEFDLALRMHGDGIKTELFEPDNGTQIFDDAFPVPPDSRSLFGYQFAMKFDTTYYIKYTLEKPLTFPDNGMTLMVEYYRNSGDRQTTEGLIGLQKSGSTFAESGIRINIGYKSGIFVYSNRPTVVAKTQSEKRYSILASENIWSDMVFSYWPDTDALWLNHGGSTSKQYASMGLGGMLWPMDEITIGKANDVFGKILVSQVTIIEAATTSNSQPYIDEQLAMRKNYKYSTICKP